MNRRFPLCALLLAALLTIFGSGSAQACGGLFCTTSPVDQAAERIIFAVNEDQGTIDAYVQINYTGSAEAFAWVVPVPSPPKLDVADMALFEELDLITQPQYIAPPLPEDCEVPVMAAADSAMAGQSVEVFGQGSVGPYDYAIVGSDSSEELVSWLRTNGYQITDAMVPLVQVYVDEEMIFLAMKLQADKGTQDIQPVKMTYNSTKPMIPLRLTAVAANPDMRVITWILAKRQVEPENYAAMQIRDEQIVFTIFGGHNYEQLVLQTADRLGGRAFVTEFAGPTTRLAVRAQDAALQQLLSQYPYMTRVYTRLSPEEMTVDPVFRFNTELPDISNVHDLSELEWDCDNLRTVQTSFSSDQDLSQPSTQQPVTAGSRQEGPSPWSAPLIVGGAIALVVLGFFGGRLVTKNKD